MLKKIIKIILNLFKSKSKSKKKEKEYIENQIKKYHDLFHNYGEYPLNRKQQEAVVKNQKYNQVIAAAGTGKTTVLAYRIKYLIEEGIEPERILAITYSNKAAEEMQIRLKEKFNITEVNVNTIHSFANSIVNEESDYKLSTVNPNDIINIVEGGYNQFLNSNQEFRGYFYKFLSHQDDEYLDEADFEEKTEYLAAMRTKKYETLKGEKVKSMAEKAIADFFFLYNIKYQYEKIAEWADKSDDKVVYQPDFYLTEYDIYLEHLGINRKNEVPEWFEWSSVEYLAKRKWAQAQFKKHNKTLLETFDYDYQEGNLEAILKEKLKRNGVKLKKRNFEEFLDAVNDVNSYTLLDDYKKFINTAKTNNVKVDQIEALLTRGFEKQYYFAKSAAMLYQYYEDYLEENRKIDFNDMIYKAAAILKENPQKYQKRYDHLLVDEFQDVSLGHIEIIKQFFEGDSKVKLFCVGDDWQSIYSFQGSDPKYFIDFEKYFGKSAKTYLVDNYRCPSSVLEAGNSLIDNNKHKIEKKVKANNPAETIPKLHILSDSNRYKHRVVNYTVNLVKKYLAEENEPKDIMIICRYDGAAPFLEEIKEKLKEAGISYIGKGDDYYNAADNSQWPENAVSIFSVHQSKGREADNVILLHMVKDDNFSFPTVDKESKLIEPVKLNKINHLEEERRLFYVAITRASKNLDILTQSNNLSPFVKEIESHLEKAENLNLSNIQKNKGFDLTAKIYRLWDSNSDKIRQRGILETRTEETIHFLAWESCGLKELEENIWYKLRNLKIKEYQGKKQIQFTAKTEIVELYQE
jgi:DNA helicase-4